MRHLLMGIAILVGGGDQLLKLYFHSSFRPGQSVPVIPNIFHLTYVQNTGAAFGVLPGARFLLVAISLAVLLFIFFYVFWRQPTSRWVQVALGFVLGGSFSNLVDRLFRGYVVDYLDFRVWPVFNIADTMINVGVGMIVLYFLFRRKEPSS